MKTETARSLSLNTALIVGIIGLVALVIYGGHFHRRVAERNAIGDSPLPPQKSHSVADTTVNPRALIKPAEAAHPNPPPSSTPLVSEKPRNVDGELSDPSIHKRILDRQSQQLRSESAAEGLHPNDKRSLTLSEEEILKLEQDGDVIF
ncbi:MAG: hypothetical protein HN341_09525 [Verrucomicrobia bacterium]|jgi:hypothetical protein|nr:hypothetical protein [Verrucomicrobiota bacterium]